MLIAVKFRVAYFQKGKKKKVRCIEDVGRLINAKSQTLYRIRNENKRSIKESYFISCLNKQGFSVFH